MSFYEKELPGIYLPFKELGHLFWGILKPVIILTDRKSVTQVFQNKMIPPPLWYACDFVVQFNITIAHNPGKMNTATDFLSRLDFDPNQKLILKIQEVMPTLPIEVNLQSTGKTQEDQVFFHTKDANLPSEQQL